MKKTSVMANQGLCNTPFIPTLPFESKIFMYFSIVAIP